MIDLRLIAESKDEVKKNLSGRNFDVSLIDEIFKLNEERKTLTLTVETSRAEINKLSKEIGAIKKSGGAADELVAKVAEVKSAMANADVELERIKLDIDTKLLHVPNMLDEEVPIGKDEAANKVVKTWGKARDFSFTPKDHVDIGEKLGLLDFEKASQISGSRFSILKGSLARMERALINFFIDQHIGIGYQEVLPPFIVSDQALIGTGQLPKFKEDLFRIDDERNFFLIPTAEVPLTNLKREEIFSADELPLKYVAYTPCFRSEAGSYGKDTRGLIRLHQFNKVELVNITTEENSKQAHDEMVAQACKMLELLGLPYRSLLLCSGDIGFGARKCFDLEVWLPSSKTYREISSISNCWDFQSRRASIRYKVGNDKPRFAHTLNGSGLAVGRTLLAIMENYQEQDGSITIPEVLRPYMGGLSSISKH